jgi:hypothetical protein
MDIAIAIRIDSRGRVSVGQIPTDQMPALEPARDIEDALESARQMLAGEQAQEERDFASGFRGAKAGGLESFERDAAGRAPTRIVRRLG